MIINEVYIEFWMHLSTVLLQVLILNNVHIAGYATPFLYIYFILKFASGTSRNELMLWAFFFGLTIDIFADTPGMNAAATVLLAFLRPSLLRLFTPRDNLDSIIPSFKSMGITPFLKYTTASVFVHSLALLSIEFFSFTSIWLFVIAGDFVHPSDFNLHSCCRRNKEIGMAKDYRLEKRKFVIRIALTIVLIYLIRLFVLQINDRRRKKNADSNAFLNKIQYPSRGAIYDRNGKLLVFNQPAYDITLVPKEVENLDTLDLCESLGITRAQFLKIMSDMRDLRRRPGYSRYTNQLFMSQLSAEECGVFQEKLFKISRFLYSAAYDPAIFIQCCRPCFGGYR